MVLVSKIKKLLARKHTVRHINEKMRSLSAPYILLAGDSHAAYLPKLSLPIDVVNVGVAGSNVYSCKSLLKQLPLRPPARLSIAIIGTNDVPRQGALRPVLLKAFERHIDSTIELLVSLSNKVLISALPPISPNAGHGRSIYAAECYNEIIQKICIARRADFIDPFDFLRTVDFNIAKNGSYMDGTHLVNYHLLKSRLEQEIHWKIQFDDYICGYPGFDQEFYLKYYPDVCSYPYGPFSHYISHGWTEGRDPCRYFSNDGYLLQNIDVVQIFENPLLHFVKEGFCQGRRGWEKTSTTPTNWDANNNHHTGQHPDLRSIISSIRGY